MKKRGLKNNVLPFCLCALIGVIVAIVIFLYKLAVHFVINLSSNLYLFLSENLIYFIPAAAVLFLISLLLVQIYKKFPQLKGGGIPISILAANGFFKIKWLSGLIGHFVLSLFSFLLGVPLGNEGPSVFMGASVGAAVTKGCCKDKTSQMILAGASTAFGATLGSPLASIGFAFEEFRAAFSKLSLFYTSLSVIFACFTTKGLSIVFKNNTKLFDEVVLKIGVADIWIPIVVGALVGLISVAFLKYYKLVFHTFNRLLSKVCLTYKIFVIFVITLILGVVSSAFISTGHSLIEGLFNLFPSFVVLIIILLVRATLSSSANANGITGGMFLPTLAIGTVAAAIVAIILDVTVGIDRQYYSIIIIFGITASIAGIMRMPVTAILFTLEALTSFNNVLSVLAVALVSYAIVTLFRATTVNELMIENFIHKKE